MSTHQSTRRPSGAVLEGYYRLLRLSRTATVDELKTSYRKLALQIHPDRHQGCPQKRMEFQSLTEAYHTVLEEIQRLEHVRKLRTTKNTAHPHPYYESTATPLYRKVYAPRPPPEWTKVFDHEKHQEMHYGDGLQKEALRRAMEGIDPRETYQSPLGRGFSFDPLPGDAKSSGGTGTSATKQDVFHGVNPFSKYAPQGPPRIVMDYVEADWNAGKAHVTRRQRIVQEMHNQRTQRQQEEKQRKKHQQQQEEHQAKQQQQQQQQWGYEAWRQTDRASHGQYQRFHNQAILNNVAAGRQYHYGTNGHRNTDNNSCVIL